MQPTQLSSTVSEESGPTYAVCRTVPTISNLLKPLDDILLTKLIPTLTGRPPPGDSEHALFALPARMGGLGITILSMQDEAYVYKVIAEQLESKAIVRNKNKENRSKAARDLLELLPDNLQRSVKLASEKGSSTWLTVLPLSEHGFALHKGAFCDVLAL